MVLISNALGEKDEEASKEYLAQASMFSFCIGVLVTLLVISFDRYLLLFLGAEGQVLEYGEQYIGTLSLGFPFLILLFTLNSGFTSRGNTKFIRNIYIMNVCINLVLDPLLLYGFSLGNTQIIPAMGIRGIAVATVLVQALGAILAFIKAVHDRDLPNRLNQYRPSLQCFKRIIHYGLPSFMQLILISVGLSVVTYFLFHFGGDKASAAYGIGLRIEQMALIPSFGLSISLSALVGQNNGAKKYSRILLSYKLVILFAVFLLIVLMLPLVFLGNVFASIFSSDVEVVRITELYLFFALVAFMGYQILNLSQGVLTGMKRPNIALVIIGIRQLVLPFISIPLLVYVFKLGIIGVFSAVVINVWIAALLMRFFALKTIQQKLAEMIK